MGINYAEKYSPLVDERFTSEPITNAATNNDYDWDGVDTVHVYSIGTAELNDYKRIGLNRYGDPEELGDSVQTMVLSQDKSFTFTIDRANYDDTMMTKEAGRALRREIDEVIIPHIDGYRLGKIASYAGKTAYGSITSSNAYEAFLSLNLEVEGPKQGRIAFVSNDFYKKLHLDDNFIKKGDMSQEMLVKGVIGEVDGVQIVPAGSALPENCDFVIAHSVATVGVQKLAEYIIHDNPPGISGWLVEGRVRFDAFVLDNKKGAIGSHWDTQAHIPATAGVPVNPPENIPNVERIPSITLNKEATTITAGETEALIANVVNADGATITWDSDTKAKATVSNKGVVTGVAAGSATITATIEVDDTEYTAACYVTVEAGS